MILHHIFYFYHFLDISLFWSVAFLPFCRISLIVVSPFISLYSLIPSLDEPLDIDYEKANQLRSACLALRSIVQVSTADDGGGKTKISSSSRFLWTNPEAVSVAEPIFSFVNSFISSQSLRNRIFFLAKSSAHSRSLFDKNRVKLVSSPIDIPNRDDLTESQRNLLDATGNIANHGLRNQIIDIKNQYPDTLLLIVRFHISFLEPGHFIYPHRDASDKFMSLMLYLPSDSQRFSSDLSTIFYSPNKSIPSAFSCDDAESILDLKKFSQCFSSIRPPFDFTNIVCFPRTPVSWHSFVYPKTLSQGTRVSININFHTIDRSTSFSSD